MPARLIHSATCDGTRGGDWGYTASTCALPNLFLTMRNRLLLLLAFLALLPLAPFFCFSSRLPTPLNSSSRFRDWFFAWPARGVHVFVFGA